ncbi:MAG: ribonuclease P protein component [Clostridium sp.]|nr:ribonuclease P protein component [Clostridium sp.]
MFKGQRLYKKERLCSKYDIDRLFAPRTGGSVTSVPVETPMAAMAFPWRAVWLPNIHPEVRFNRVMIVVPKRRLRHAVDRVTMRRRLRECYRLMRADFPSMSRGYDIAFIYVADRTKSSGSCRKSLQRLFKSIKDYDDKDSLPDNEGAD